MKDFKKSNLSWKEKKILKELDINARQSISGIGSKLKMSKQTVNYHIKNMLKKGFIKEFITYIDTQKLGYTFYNILIKLKYTTKEDRVKIVDKLKKISNVVWISSFRGEWHMIVSILAKDVGEFSMFLEQVLSSLKGRLLDYDFFIVISASQLGYKKIHSGDEKGYSYHAKVGHKDLANISGNDLKVLKILANNAKMSNVDIAKKTRLTIEKVRYSLKKLEREKVVQGYKPLVDVSKLGYFWHIMFLRLKSSSEGRKEEMVSFLKGLPEVFYVVRGVGNCNLMVEFQTKTVDEFEKVKDIVSTDFRDMIADEKTVQLTEEHKCTYFPGSLG
ncbi:Lrp/AsnC family transcriptional regulator [archaeon]|nr:Lrp/AsnC family transcriptional regulator [archaeon]